MRRIRSGIMLATVSILAGCAPLEWWEAWPWWSKALLIVGAIVVGGTNLFMTAAIILAIGALAYVNQSGMWDAWPWWGNLLFVLGMFLLPIAAIALDGLRRQPKADAAPAAEEKKE